MPTFSEFIQIIPVFIFQLLLMLYSNSESTRIQLDHILHRYMDMASTSSSNPMIVNTGPKISSWETLMLLEAFEKIVG